MTALFNLLIDIAGFLLEWLIVRPVAWICGSITGLLGVLIAKVSGKFAGSIVRQINKGKAQ